MPSFSAKSSDRLSTCEPDLQRLFNEVIKDIDCTVLEGHRSPERQEQLVSEGKSKTLKSNHLYSPSRAVDVMPYPVIWGDRLGQHEFATQVFSIATRLNIQVEWGGNWDFYDAPHWQLKK